MRTLEAKNINAFYINGIRQEDSTLKLGDGTVWDDWNDITFDRRIFRCDFVDKNDQLYCENWENAHYYEFEGE